MFHFDCFPQTLQHAQNNPVVLYCEDLFLIDWLTELRFSVQTDIKYVIKETIIPVNLLASSEKQNQNVKKQRQNNNTLLTTLCLGLPRWACNKKEKPIWILQLQKYTINQLVC